MNAPQQLAFSIMALFSLSACWEGDPKIEIRDPITKYIATVTVPEFKQCSFQDQEALARAERVIVLPSATCADGQCLVTGRGYNSRDLDFHVARLSENGECFLEKAPPIDFTEFYSLEVFMNEDYLRSLGLSRAEIDGLDLHNFAGTRHGELRGLWFDEINHDATITIIYEKLPAEDDFVVSGQKVSFTLPSGTAPSDN